MVRAYVSSTFADLEAHRAVVLNSIRRLGVESISMESYVADDRRPLDRCLADVRAADVYIGLFAWRYGYVPPGEDRSITELEYREAERSGIPSLIFLVDEDAPWPRRFIDREPDAHRIEALRSELLASHLCSVFRDPEELGALAAAAVANFLASAVPATLDPGAVERYQRRMRAALDRLDLDVLTPPTDDDAIRVRLPPTFIEPMVRGDGPPQPLFEAVTAPDNTRIVLVGDPGSGKSTSVQAVALGLVGDDGDERLTTLSGRLPLLVTLRDLAAGDRDILDHLDRRAATDGLGFGRAELEPYLGGGRALVIFDGLDEVFDPRRREEISREIVAFADAYPGVRVIVTSRPGASAGLPGFTPFLLQDLDDDQITAFLERWYAAATPGRPRAAEVAAALRSTPAMRELAANPMLLTILAIMGRKGSLTQEAWRVYDHVVTVLAGHWDVNRHLSGFPGTPAFLRVDDRLELLRRLAVGMLTSSADATMDATELDRQVSMYLVERFDMSGTAVRRAAPATIAELDERNFLLRRLESGRYAFVHRAFLESFGAQEIVQRFERSRTLSEQDLVTLVVGHSADPAWWEVLRLVGSMLHPGATSRLIDRLAEADRPWAPGPFPAPPRALALAVRLVGDARRLAPLRDTTVRVLRQLVLLLEHGVGLDDPGADDLIDRLILPAIRPAGSSWPGREAYLSWYRRRGRHLRWEPVSMRAARLAAGLATPADAIEGLFAGADPIHSRASVAGLTELGRADPHRAEPYERLLSYARDAGDTVTRVAALGALGELYGDAYGTREAVAVIVHGESPAAVRAAAIRLLDENYADARQILIERVTDEHPEVRLAAVEVLPRVLAPAEARSVLLDRIRNDPDPRVLTAAAARAGEDVTGLLAARAGTGSGAAVRLAAIRLLSGSGVFQELLRTDDDPGVLAWAAAAVRRSDPLAARDLLFARRETDNTGAVARVLGELFGTDPEVEDWLAGAALGHPASVVRAAALGAVPGPRRGAIIEAMSDPDTRVRTAAAGLLGRVPPELVESRLERLRLVASGDPLPEIRAAAVRVLAAAEGQTSFIGRLLTKEANRVVAIALLEVVTPGPAVRDRLLLLAAERYADVRAAALDALSRLYPADADVRQRLLDAVLDPATEVREGAAHALCALAAGDADLRDLIAEWAAEAPDPAVRSIAAQALSWLVGADPDRFPDLDGAVSPLPEEAESDPEVVLPQVFADLGAVFRQTGLPTHTFVEPPDLHLLELALSQPGVGIVIEGPSGIGKTTLVHSCLDRMRRDGYPVEEFAGKVGRTGLDRLWEIASDEPHGIVAVDDFHRLPADLREALTDQLKLLADRGEQDRRLIIIGIPETGHSLIRYRHDLATRMQVIKMARAPEKLVLEMIDRGEKALNVTFTQSRAIAREAAGSLNLAQILCLHTAFLNGVTGTVDQHRVIDDGVQRALSNADRNFAPVYGDLIRTFGGLDGEKRRTCIDLLLRLGRTDGLLVLDEVAATDAGIARDIQALLDRFPAGLDDETFRDHLFLDVHARHLVAEDPRLLFHLRQRRREDLIRLAGKREMLPRSQIFISYSHADRDWLHRLRKHLAPLKARDYIDAWDDKDLNPGDRWRDEIENALDRAKIAILLISENFLESDFISQVELPRLLAASRTEGCRIWPVIVAHSVYAAIPELAAIQTFNDPKRPLDTLSGPEQAEILRDLALKTRDYFPG